MNAYELLQLQQAQEEAQRRNYFKGWAKQQLNNGIQKAAQDVLVNKIAPAMANTAIGKTVASAGSKVGGALAGGPVGPLIALGLTALQGTNRKRAKATGNELMKNTNQMAEQGIEQAEELNNQAKNETENQVAQNITKSIQPLQLDMSQQEYNPLTDQPTYLQGKGYSNDVQYGDYVEPQQGQVSENVEAVKNGLLDKFINGVTDFSRGYQENSNNAFRPENLKNNQFAVPNGPDETQYVDKTKMGRLGEAAGTISRALQKPGVQAALAGGISTALTGNPLYGVGMAYKFGNNRANTNMYDQALKDQGIEANPGPLGSIGAGDFNSLMMPQYKQAMNDINLARLQEMQAYHEMMNQYNKERLEADKEYKAKKLEIDKQKIANKGTKSGNGKTGGGAKPPKYGNGFVIMEAPNGKQYRVPESQISRYKKAGGKIVG